MLTSKERSVLAFLSRLRLTALFFLGLALLSISQFTVGGQDPATGVITTVAGTGTAGFSGDGGPATSAQIRRAEGVAVDPLGNVYIADTGNHRIRKVTPDGVISTVAGNGKAGFSGDGGPATSAQLDFPAGVAVDSVGNLYIADSFNGRIRKLTPGGLISTVAGGGTETHGEGGLATSAELEITISLAVDSAGNLYFIDSIIFDDPTHLHKVTPDGLISIVVGTEDYLYPEGIALDSVGNLYFSDGYSCRIFKLSPDGTMSPVAENGSCGGSLALDRAGSLYIAGGNRIRKVTPEGVISTIAGTGVRGYNGDDQPATSAQLSGPMDLAIAPDGDLLIVETDFMTGSGGGNRVRKIENVTAGTSNNASYFPQVVVGSGWSTHFAVTNTGEQEAGAELFLTDGQGSPLAVHGQLAGAPGTSPAQDPGAEDSFALTVPSGGTVFLTLTGLQEELQTGWARLESTVNSLTALATYEYSDGTQCRVGVLQAWPLQDATIPVDVDTQHGRRMAYAVANPGGQEIVIRVALVAQDGTVQNDDFTMTLDPGEQRSGYLFEQAPPEEFKGSAVFRATHRESFVVIALSDKDGLLTLVPVTPAKAPGIPD